jgi:DNA sulfur modification protein DndD
VILDEIVLHNFGLFGGRHVVKLTPAPNKPIVLVGGLNGTGKTTLLDAIGLALYGPHAAIGRRRTGAYDDYLGGAIHRGVDPRDGAAVEVAFRARQGGRERTIRVRRSWTKRGVRVREHLDVYDDGERNSALTDSWASHVEAFIPRGVAPLFFFDGEQLEAFADLDRARDLLATAVSSLLGLELVDRLVGDLAVLERRRKLESSRAPVRAEIDRLEAEIARCGREERRRVEELSTAEASVASLQRKYSQLDERFRREGGELFEMADALSVRRSEIVAQLKALEERLREQAGHAMPLLLVAPAVRKLAARRMSPLQGEELVRLLQARDETLLSTLREHAVAGTVLEIVERSLLEDRSARATDQEWVDPDAVAQAQVLENVVMPEATSVADSLLSDIGCAQDELEALDRKLSSVPAPDAIADLLSARERAAAEVRAAEEVMTERREAVAAVHRDIERRRAEVERLLDASAHETLAEEQAARVLGASARARETAARFRVAATQRHLGRIQRLILDSLELLLRKERLVADIKIDPESFAVELVGSDSKTLHPQELSAGERQLLATAMVWGLARASGRPLPVVVDTPLGRLDSTHREHLVERYFPNASHQVVLLSTDEEIDADNWTRLRPRVARSYRLDFDEATASTTVNDGYFF